MTDGDPCGTDEDRVRGASSAEGDEFGDALGELKADGCNLLLVGDAPRRLFTEASAQLLGGTDRCRYRLVAITDASQHSVVERLPNSAATSGDGTTEIVDHAGPPRAVAVDAGGPTTALDDLPERPAVDPKLARLQAELVEGMAALDDRASGLAPAQLRVCVDSLDALIDHYDRDVVRRCLQVVTGYVDDYSGMGHYVLTDPYGSERVEALAGEFDAVVELRPVDHARGDRHAEERWHVSDRDLTTDWLPM